MRAGGERLLAATEQAPWLPPGSAAEVWVGADCAVPEPAIIVRLLLTRRTGTDNPAFFCVPTAKGPDLPTRFLGTGHERVRPYDGLVLLLGDVLGDGDAATRCVGYVRNVVPRPDDSYPHPTPRAHVPVFVGLDAGKPVADGEWVSLGRGRAELRSRHWWPIVEHHLTAAE